MEQEIAHIDYMITDIEYIKAFIGAGRNNVVPQQQEKRKNGPANL